MAKNVDRARRRVGLIRRTGKAYETFDVDHAPNWTGSGGWFWKTGPRDKLIKDTQRYPTFEAVIAAGLAAGRKFGNGGWKRKLLSWNWHNVTFDRHPGWEIECDRMPAWCRIEHVNGDTWENGKPHTDREPTKSSSDAQNAWDDLAAGWFYSRDISYDGSCSVVNREPYGSLWWFQTLAERDRFLAWLPTFCPLIKVIYRNGNEIPAKDR